VIEGESAYLAIKKMRVVIDREEELKGLELNADPTLMRIVFSNLITNAIKYGIEGGAIIIGFMKRRAVIISTLRMRAMAFPPTSLKSSSINSSG